MDALHLDSADERADRSPTVVPGRHREPVPRRIRLSRAPGWRKPSGAVVVARPTRWGNPFRVGSTYMWLAGEEERTWPVPTAREPGDHPDGARVVRCPDTATAVRWFRRWAEGDYAAEARRVLRGHDLACWCPLDRPCHADVLLEVANSRRRVPGVRSSSGAPAW